MEKYLLYLGGTKEQTSLKRHQSLLSPQLHWMKLTYWFSYLFIRLLQALEMVAVAVEEEHKKASYRNFPSRWDYVIVDLEMIVEMHSSS